MQKKIAIQGFEGCFHQQAARNFFGKKIEVFPCATFKELIKAAESNEHCSGAVMAIENSIAGSILPNYNLLKKSKLTITGEVYLKIDQHLMVNPSVNLEDIREVHSHPMAIQQCYDYLEKYNWKLVETEDTALSARHVQQHNCKHIAAIAGKLAAELYQLKIIAPGIHSEKNNLTRFLVLQNSQDAIPVENANKASVNFQTDHTKGSLAKVLTVISKEGVNLSKLQSFPIPGSDFMYSFHADLEFDDQKQLTKVLKKMKPETNALKVFGIYKNGKK
jgi:prephenate dehydratase